MFLSEILRNFDSQLSQEQTWAVCHATTQYLTTNRRENMIKRRSVHFEIEAETVQLTKAGGVEIMCKEETARRQSESEIIQRLGTLLMKCLGRKFEDLAQIGEPDLIELISGLMNRKFDEHDEGYEGDYEYGVSVRHKSSRMRHFRNLDDICVFCDDRLQRRNIASGSQHYLNVIKALLYEAYELKSFLDHVTSSLSLASETGERISMAPSVANTAEECVHEWARFWLQVMHELRRGVHLKRVSQTKISPEEYELLPQELVLNSEIPPAITSRSEECSSSLPENAREIILEFISSKHEGKQKLRLLPYVGEIDDTEVDGIDTCADDIEATDDDNLSNVENEAQGAAARRPLKVESQLWDRVNNWDASLESLLSNDRTSRYNDEICSGSLLHDVENFESRRNSYDLGNASPRRTPEEAQRRWSADSVYKTKSLTDLTNSDYEDLRDANANAKHVTKKRLAVSPECFTEVSLEEDQRVYGTSLFEISKTRKAIAVAEEEMLPRNDSKTNAIRNGLICFACKKSKFSFFSRAHQCHVCSKKFCGKCIVENIEVPNHLVDTKQQRGNARGSEFATSKGLSKSLNDLVTGVGETSITPFPCKRHSLLQIGSRRTYGGKVTNMCEDCKLFIESIITETKNLRWHVGMTIDI